MIFALILTGRPRVLALNYTRDRTDNAAYHHCRGIPSLPALKKKADLFDLIMEVGIDKLTLRPTDETTGPQKRERPIEIAINATTRDYICSTASKLKVDVPTGGAAI
jgi:hypothetical protein